MGDRLLMVPGPTNLSESVREVMSKPQVGHTDPDFVTNFSETLQLARKVFRNDRGHQFVFTGSGTVGMEAAVASTVEPGDKVLVLNTGHFGQRFVDINGCYGADTEEISPGFGNHASPDAVRKRLAGGRFKALFVTHVDTGTTVCNPITEIVREAKNAGVLAIVDGVCSGQSAENLDANVLWVANAKLKQRGILKKLRAIGSRKHACTFALPFQLLDR